MSKAHLKAAQLLEGKLRNALLELSRTIDVMVKFKNLKDDGERNVVSANLKSISNELSKVYESLVDYTDCVNVFLSYKEEIKNGAWRN